MSVLSELKKMWSVTRSRDSTHSGHEVEVCGDVEGSGSNRHRGKQVSVFEVRIPETLAR